MKRIFLILFLVLMLPVFSFALDCHTESYSLGNARSYARVCAGEPKCDGNSDTGLNSYCAGRWYFDVSFKGDDHYVVFDYDFRGSDDYSAGWGGIDFDSDITYERVNDGRIYINDRNGDGSGESTYKGFRFWLLSYDYDMGTEYEVYSYQTYNWRYHHFYWDVECVDNSDCGSNSFCDKSDGKKNAECVEKECSSGETKCENKVSYKCENYKWVNEGRSVDTCGVECLSVDGCDSKDTFVGSKYCTDDNTIGRDYLNYSCEIPIDDNVVVSNDDYFFKCDFENVTRVVDTCEEKCIDGSCEEYSFFERIWVWFESLFQKI